MRQIFHLHWKILVCWRNYDWMLLFSCIIIIHANNFIIIIYVTVVSPLQRSLVQEASVTQGHALQVAEARKIATHDQNCRSEGIVFVPLAVETLGGWSSLAVDTIKAFSRLQDQRLGIAMNFSLRRHLFQRLSITLWRCNAWMWISWCHLLLPPAVDGIQWLLPLLCS